MNLKFTHPSTASFMRALHVIPALAARYGGPSLAAVEMGRALQQEGIEVVVATTNADGPGALPVEVGTIQDHDGVPAIFFARRFSEAFKYSPDLSNWVDARCTDFDVVHIHGVFSHACLAAAAACRRTGIPYVVRPLGNLTPRCLAHKPLRKRAAWHAGVKTMLDGAAAIHYTSEAERAEVESTLRLGRGVVIPLGVTKNDLPADRSGFPYVVTLCRIDPIKRLELLVDAFIDVTCSEELGDWRLVVAGDGEPGYVSRLVEMVFKARVEHRILFTGWLDGDEKRHVLRDASLFALTSAHENFGMSVAEAMAAGLPVLVSRQVGLSPEIRRADAGWITSLEPADVRKQLRDALLHQTLREKRGVHARDLVHDHFTWPKVAERLKVLYAGVAYGETFTARAA